MTIKTLSVAAALFLVAGLTACNDPNAKKAGDDLQSAAANAGEVVEGAASDAMAAAADAADTAGDAAANATDNVQQGAATAATETDQAMNEEDLAAAGDTSRRPAEEAPAQE